MEQEAAFQVTYTQLFINNEYVDAKSKGTIDVINPATEEVFTKVQAATGEDVDTAVKAARAAFINGWRDYNAQKRSELIQKFASLLEKYAEELAYLETIDNGKPLMNSQDDIAESVKVFKFFAGFCDKVWGKTLPTTDNIFAHTRREPLGVVGLIAPWNYPIMMATWKIAPALAAGNSIVFKPSEVTPLTAIRLGAIFKEAGFPAGVVNIVPGYGKDAGEALARHLDVDKISFTGSTVTGRRVMIAAAESNLKKVTLELGGKSPTVVFADADLDKAAMEVFYALFTNMAQDCTAGSRCFVEESIYDQFLEKLAMMKEGIFIGPGLDEASNFGPLVSKLQFDKVMDYIETARKENLELLVGGTRWGEKGYFVEPTIFKNVPDDSRLAREEIFGPVLVVMKPFKTMAEVIERANNTTYGLGAGIWTKDMNKAEKFTREIKSGTVWVNTYGMLNTALPFGGFKQSGIGKDLGEEAIADYFNTKTVFNQFNFNF